MTSAPTNPVVDAVADPFGWTDGIAWHKPAHRAVMASVRLGAWMSAALDDPQVCEEMKADINEWFSAGEPMEILGQALAHRQSADAALVEALEAETERCARIAQSYGSAAFGRRDDFTRGRQRGHDDAAAAIRRSALTRGERT